MGKPIAKARSSTTESAGSYQARPISRASTTSAHTANEQPLSQRRHTSGPIAPVAQYVQSQYQTASNPAQTANLLGEQMARPHQESPIDPSLQSALQESRSRMPLSGGYDRTGQSHTMQEQQLFYQSKENTPFAGGDIEHQQDEFVSVDPQKKKGTNTSAANDQELRRLYQENKGRTLRDIADTVLAEERGPRSEKTKQIFAMIWLSTVCHKGSGSVPRNRVFSHYATKCGNERVPPLNPASFGKLVRIIFPGIQTRRLGMRGESKYHYVDLEMDENGGHSGEDSATRMSFGGHADESSGLRRQRLHVAADTAMFPPPLMSASSMHGPLTQRNMNSRGCLFLNTNQPGLYKGPSTPNLVSRELHFASHTDAFGSDDQAIELPGLNPYVPPGTDPDSAEALKALYRAHCIAVIDAFRYCKEKVFYHAFTSFHGTLTVPVQKLLAHPNLAPWIKECDWIMYKKMIGYVSHLALQVMPVKVLDTLRTISARLGPHILNTFQNHPAHVRDARHGPAIIFASLLDRLLRVNATAHAAANLLTDSVVRNQMWVDWALFVRPSNVAETCLPGAGYTRTLQILTNDIREMLGPLNMVIFDGMQPIFHETASLHAPNDQHHGESDLDTEGILDRWNNFLLSLPTRFPHVGARTIIDCVGQVGAAALRDMTMADARSFGTWWVTKSWIDEMLLWHAEKGGFLERSPSSVEMRPPKRSALAAGFDVDDDGSYGNDSQRQTDHSHQFSRSGYYGSPQLMQCFDHMQQPNSQNVNGGLSSKQDRSGADAVSRNHDQHPETNQKTSQNQAQHQNGVQYNASGMMIRNGNYAGHSNSPSEKNDPASAAGIGSYASLQSKGKDEGISAQKIDEQSRETTDALNDDSGIGLDIELPPQPTPLRMTDYGSFVGNGATASDPADVVVC